MTFYKTYFLHSLLPTPEYQAKNPYLDESLSNPKQIASSQWDHSLHSCSVKAFRNLFLLSNVSSIQMSVFCGSAVSVQINGKAANRNVPNFNMMLTFPKTQNILIKNIHLYILFRNCRL